MPGLGLATLLPLLNDLHAGRHSELTATAAGRNAGLVAVATTTVAIAAAIADLDEKICPIVRELDRSRTDRRWHAFRAACDTAAQHTARLADTITSAAGDALLVVTDLEPLQYTGSITARHGLYVFAGPCTCRRCGQLGDRLRLCRPFDDVTDVTCVRPGSVTAAPLAEPTDLPAARFAALLRAAIATVSTPVEAVPAATLIHAMALLAGRTRLVLSTWSEAVNRRLCGPPITALDGTFAPRHSDAINDRLDRAAAGLTTLQQQLRDAAATLRDISAEPPHAATAR